MRDLVLAAAMDILASGSGQYSRHFIQIADQYGIDPMLAVAVAYKESKLRRRCVSKTNDYGLMQLHVSTSTLPSYLGREKRLFIPRLNIRLGIRAMRWWKRYHHTRCKGNHHWLLHYNQGRRVTTKGHRGGYADRVLKIYQKLIQIKSNILGSGHVAS